MVQGLFGSQSFCTELASGGRRFRIPLNPLHTSIFDVDYTITAGIAEIAAGLNGLFPRAFSPLYYFSNGELRFGKACRKNVQRGPFPTE
jgi:hypothetical protein